MLRFRWITFDRFKVVNLSRFYRVNFIRPYWVNFTVFSNSGIIARVLHLADRQDVTTNGKEITTATQPISVVLDPEAAKIIQSIGRRTVKE